MKWTNVKILSQSKHFLTGQWILSRKPAPTKLSYVTPRQGSPCLCSIVRYHPLLLFLCCLLLLVGLGWDFAFSVLMFCRLKQMSHLRKEIRSHFLLPSQHLAQHFTHSRYSVKARGHWRLEFLLSRSQNMSKESLHLVWQYVKNCLMEHLR